MEQAGKHKYNVSMTSTLDRILATARQTLKRIVLCEGHDPRILEAAGRAAADRIASVCLVGDCDIIDATAAEHKINLEHVERIDPRSSPLQPQIVQALREALAKRQMTNEQVHQKILDPLVFALLMVRLGHADGSVAGAVHTTASVVRQSIRLIGLRADKKLLSGIFIMLRNEPFHTTTQALIFSDCAVNIDPDEHALTEIALTAADCSRLLLGQEPRVAMLSFSTQGSADHPNVDKVARATAQIRQRRPSLLIDGEVQLDAAVVPEVAARKIAGSQTGGAANVLIFPNLDAANIGYKLTERLGCASAIGPILLELNKPANDLSRGCSVTDIYNMIAVTAIQAQQHDAQDSARPGISRGR